MKTTNRIHQNNTPKCAESQATRPHIISAVAAQEGALQVSDAVAKACAMLELIGDHLDVIAGRDQDDSAIEEANYFNFGLSMIVSDVTQELKLKSEQMADIARGEIDKI
jgi:hypothetical protein